MHIKLISKNERAAKLANRRCTIMRDNACREPDVNMDLIFHRGPGEVFGFKLKETYGTESEVFCADRAKIEEMSKACGHKTKADTEAWLDGIKNAESLLWQAWMDGDIYGIVIQEWNAAERDWTTIDCNFELFGWENVIMTLHDMNLDGVEVFCVDENVGYPNTWKDEFREFDI